MALITSTNRITPIGLPSGAVVPPDVSVNVPEQDDIKDRKSLVFYAVTGVLVVEGGVQSDGQGNEETCRQQLFAELKALGANTGASSKTETLVSKLAEAKARTTLPANEAAQKRAPVEQLAALGVPAGPDTPLEELQEALADKQAERQQHPPHGWPAGPGWPTYSRTMMADFYETVVGADAYRQTRGNTAWAAAAEADRGAALAQASTYIGSLGTQQPVSGCVLVFPGKKAGGRAQALQWPRVDAVDRNGELVPADEVPREVGQATYEATLRELLKPGGLNPDYVAITAMKRIKVGPLETESFGPTRGDGQPNKPFIGVINDFLAPIMVLRYPIPVILTV